jgi:pimeloyl-ACP methyl ester carboxylesterase
MRVPRFVAPLLAGIGIAAVGGVLSAGDDSQSLLTVDHYVAVKSTVPAIAGQTAQIYVRERVQAGTGLRGVAANRVVLFVHGAGTPSEVAFDVPYQDYSWMSYLARGGFDVFAMDTTGYGRSTRPAPMNDPCNLAKDRQMPFVKAPCAPSYPHQLTTIASDWDDINAVVDHIRGMRHTEQVALVAWSLGGPRAAGYAAQHPDKVSSLVLLAPAYNRAAQPAAPAKMPPDGVPMNTQSRDEFFANWDRQAGCSDQYDRAASESVWSAMLESDPVGATWGPGVRRAPQTAVWGWTQAVAAKTMTPTLMVAAIHDKQVPPERVRDLYADLGAQNKVLVDLGCSSHNAAWERNHLQLFRASAEWLTTATVNGMKQGVVKIGYPAGE